MIRSEELIDGLVASLHFHNYLQVTSDVLFVEGPLNVVANDHKKEHIQEYIDDVFIDLFFRTHNFKPIIIPDGWRIRKYSKNGYVETKGPMELNLNNPYDRYTFIDCLSLSLMSNCGDFCQLFPKNRFLNDIMVIDKSFGPIWNSMCLTTDSPYGDEFEQYLFYLYGMMHSKYKPTYRAHDIFAFSNLYFSKLYMHCYEGLTSHGLLAIAQRQNGYREIKDIHTFGEYTNEDIFLIYCLLVDKLKMEEYSFLSQIGIFTRESEDKKCFLNEFKTFELEHTTPDCIKPYIRDRDLFMRFTSSSKSKAVKFSYGQKGYAEIQFFNEKPIPTITVNNSLPLPFLYNEIF